MGKEWANRTRLTLGWPWLGPRLTGIASGGNLLVQVAFPASMAMPTHPLADGIIALRPFVPGRDFALSKRFYSDLGFQVLPLGDKLASVSIGAFAFLLQDFFVEEWADNFMMHMLVSNLDQWWESIAALDLAARYGVRAPRPPRLEPWGLRVAYVFDPSGVLWHFAEEAEVAAPAS